MPSPHDLTTLVPRLDRGGSENVNDTLYFTQSIPEKLNPRCPEPNMTRAHLFAALLLSITVPCFAADKGDGAAGKSLAYTCAGCHGITGWKNAYPNYHVPRIGGQNYDYLVAALTEYKKGERAHPTMRVQGESLSEQDIRDVATYLSALAP